MVNAYKVSIDLSTIKLDELFYELELHEQTNLSQKEKGIIFFVGQTRIKEDESKSKEDEEELTLKIMETMDAKIRSLD